MVIIDLPGMEGVGVVTPLGLNLLICSGIWAQYYGDLLHRPYLQSSLKGQLTQQARLGGA